MEEEDFFSPGGRRLNVSAVGICFTHSCFDTRRGDRELFSGSRACVCVCSVCAMCVFVRVRARSYLYGLIALEWNLKSVREMFVHIRANISHCFRLVSYLLGSST